MIQVGFQKTTIPRALRSIALALLWLVGGTVFNLLITATIAMTTDRSQARASPLYHLSGRQFTWLHFGQLGYARIEYARPPPSSSAEHIPLSLDVLPHYWLDGVPANSSNDDRLQRLVTRAPPSWTYFGAHDGFPTIRADGLPDLEVECFDEAIGLPFLAFKCTWYLNVAENYQVLGGFRIAGAVARPAELRSIPASPIWGGAIANAVVWGALLYWIHRSLRTWRRWRRRRTGKCRSCGYVLQGTSSLRCPECGVERPKRGLGHMTRMVQVLGRTASHSRSNPRGPHTSC